MSRHKHTPPSQVNAEGHERRSTSPIRPARFLAVFAGCALVAFGVLTAPFAGSTAVRYSTGLVHISAAVIQAAGGRVAVDGPIMRSPANGFGIEMKNGCNGVNVMILLWSAMVAFPAPWTWKAKGLIGAFMAIQGINFLRFISLFYLGQYSMEWFEFAHAYLWESLIMLDALVIFWLWALMVLRSKAGPDAV